MVTCQCGNWKYGYNANSTDELYNLADDPCETRNVIDDPANLAVRRDLLGRIAKQLPGGVCQGAERRLKEI
jgi:hypothetical protein